MRQIPTRRPVDPVPGEYVLLPRSSHVHTDARPDAPRARLPAEPHRDEEWEPDPREGPFVPMKLVAARGDFLEVETLGGDDEHHCYEDPRGLRSLRLRLFVRRDALAWVTRERTTRSYPDETSIDLVRGVGALALRDERGESEIAVDGMRLRVPFPDDAFSLSYAPAERVAPHPAALEDTEDRELHALSADARVTIAGRAHAGDDLGLGSPSSDARFVRERHTSPVGTSVSLETDCARLRVLVDSESIVEAANFGVSGFGGAIGSDRIEAGTAVYWPDGRRAGTAVSTIDVTFVETARGLRCFDHALHGDDEGSLRLCVDPDAVIPAP